MRMWDRPVGRILYAARTRRAIIPLGAPLLARSSHLPACSDGPPLCARRCAHAYLVLLQIEVTAFHPAAPHRETRRAARKSPCRCTNAFAADSSLWPCSSARLANQTCRTAVSRYPARWSPDLPRCLRTAIARPAPRRYCSSISRSGVSTKAKRRHCKCKTSEADKAHG